MRMPLGSVQYLVETDGIDEKRAGHSTQHEVYGRENSVAEHDALGILWLTTRSRVQQATRFNRLSLGKGECTTLLWRRLYCYIVSTGKIFVWLIWPVSIGADIFFGRSFLFPVG